MTAARWYRLGLAALLLTLLMAVLMQALKGDWMPPEISFSQYGVGPSWWAFSLFSLGVAATPLCFDRAMPTHRAITWMLLIGAAGCLLMAIVHTDAGGLQQSTRAKVHMVGSVVGLVMVPLGAFGASVLSGRIHRWVPICLTLISAACLVLLLVSAAGVDTLGVGTQRSWALWQTGAVLADVAGMLLLAVLARPRRQPPPGGGDPRHPARTSGRPGVTAGPTTS
ncbi:DUF998 domain-containing protein [Nakamurella aerolata]|uniref:DUF998 domain-containing protein n=1 Tax=Nakamurella aerolata TaxID=1656892 RepID=A0A849A2P4_9ACTN|nr:DUF998 domain-containing protein [Nakamurella aerolata]